MYISSDSNSPTTSNIPDIITVRTISQLDGITTVETSTTRPYIGITYIPPDSGVTNIRSDDDVTVIRPENNFNTVTILSQYCLFS
jgi:hypothetical protein